VSGLFAGTAKHRSERKLLICFNQPQGKFSNI
jgi:hypothetical protein